MDTTTMIIPIGIDAALTHTADWFDGCAGVFVGRDRAPVTHPKSALVSGPRPAGPVV